MTREINAKRFDAARPFAARVLLSATLLAAAGCAHSAARAPGAGPCHGGERAMVRDALYFGSARPDGGRVGDADWRAFERETLIPAFPAGFSVVDVSGHWRGDDGSLVAEATRMVVILHANDDASERAVAAIAAAYKQRFAQESVLRERSAACATF